MKEGYVSWAYKNMLGYENKDGKIAIVDEETILVRRIYRMFLKEGKTCTGIAECLISE